MAIPEIYTHSILPHNNKVIICIKIKYDNQILDRDGKMNLSAHMREIPRSGETIALHRYVVLYRNRKD